MSVVRELVTMLRFQTDQGGLNEFKTKANTAANDIKRVFTTVGAFIGVQLAAGGVRALGNMVREAERTNAQIRQMLDPAADAEGTLSNIFQIAQRTGQAYNVVGQRFRSMAIAADEAGVSQDYALAAVENIQKALEVNLLSVEDQRYAFNRVEYAMRRGMLTERAFGDLLQQTPRVVELLGEALGKTTNELREMAKDGDLTNDVLIRGLGKTSEMLEKDFAQVPMTLGFAFNYARNEILRVITHLWTMSGTVNRVAQAIVWFTRQIVSWGETFVEWAGGAENAVKLIESALIAAFGYKAITMLMAFIAKAKAAGVATTIAFAKFAAIAAAIAAAAVIIQDIIGWIRGDESVTGWLLGDFESFKSNFAWLGHTADAIKAVFQGDWSGAVDSLGKALNNFRGMVGSILESIGGRIAGWLGLTEEWEAALRVVKFVFGLIDQATEAVMSVIKGIIALLSGDFAGAVGHIRDAFGSWLGIFGSIGSEILRLTGLTDAWHAVVRSVQNAFNWFATSRVGRLMGLGGSADGAEEIGPNAVNPDTVARNAVEAVVPDELVGGDRRNWWQRNAPALLGGQAATDVPAGALAAGPSYHNEQHVENNVPITNNVTVTAPITALDEIEATVSRYVARATSNMADETARSLTRAMPRTEMATGAA